MELHGVLTAIVTPFDQTGEVDFDGLERTIEYQLERGASGLVPCGSTGEFYAMTTAERGEVLAFVAKRVRDRAVLIAGTNGGSTREIINSTKQARDLGYAAVLLSPPYYSLPSQGELIAHFRKIVDNVDIDLILYNFPARSGVEIGFEVLDAFKDDPRVIGIKESSGSLARAVEIRTRYGDAYHLSCGSDDIAFDFMLWGAKSWICGPANCFAVQANAMMRAFESGMLDAARAEMKRVFPAMLCLESGKFVQKVKYGCELLGVPVGEARQPLLPLSAEEKADFRKVFELAYA